MSLIPACFFCGYLMTEHGPNNQCPVDKSTNHVDNSENSKTDTLEISTEAQLLHDFETRGMILVNKTQHEEAIASQVFLARIALVIRRLLDADNDDIERKKATHELRSMRDAGWF